MADHEPRDLLLGLFEAAVAAVTAQRRVPPALPAPPPGRLVVLGAGKAAAAMARATEDRLGGAIERGLVVTRHGHEVPCRKIEVVEAGHPLPDEAGPRAARQMLQWARALGEEDLALCLFSGGGSALLALPAPGITLEDKQAVTRALLRSGADIAEMNCVRKHLSAIKGGRLARACRPARVVTLAISDVVGDDPGVIASGPTAPDPTTFADARAILARYGIRPPRAVAEFLAQARDETPKNGDPCFARAEYRIVARARDALDAAAARARAAGLEVIDLGDRVTGEARQAAADHARTVFELRATRAARPFVVLSGGETTVTVRGRGRGGRNAEFLLALVLELDGAPGVWALACDTDGIDGTEDNAGCVSAPDTLARARRLGLDARAMLEDNDAYGFFSALGDLVVTGPTRTNVNDFRAIVVYPDRPGGGGAGSRP